MDAPPTESKENRKSRSKGCLRWFYWIFLVVIALIVGDHIVEDIWGIYSWHAAKKELQAAGISIERQDYIPAPIPDSQNFAALPLFNFAPESKNSAPSETTELSKALSPLLNHESFSKEEASKPGMLPYLEPVPPAACLWAADDIFA